MGSAICYCPLPCIGALHRAAPGPCTKQQQGSRGRVRGCGMRASTVPSGGRALLRIRGPLTRGGGGSCKCMILHNSALMMMTVTRNQMQRIKQRPIVEEGDGCCDGPEERVPCIAFCLFVVFFFFCTCITLHHILGGTALKRPSPCLEGRVWRSGQYSLVHCTELGRLCSECGAWHCTGWGLGMPSLYPSRYDRGCKLAT